ncbi:ABC transporter ATP-binding protein [Patescibacteria group bacterium]|nr:ABC transporter ATP-binding protein [Patescibacteria group bacterium]
MLKDKISSSKISFIKTFSLLIRVLFFGFKSLPLFSLYMVFFTIFHYGIGYLRSFIDASILDSIIKSTQLRMINNDLLMWFIVLVFAYFVMGVFFQLEAFVETVYNGRFSKILDFTLSNKLSTLDFSYFEDPETSRLIQKIRNNSYRVRNYLYNTIDVVGILISILVAWGIVHRINPYIFLLLVLSYLPYAISEFKLGKSLYSLWDSKGETRMHANYIEEYLSEEKNLREVRVFALQKHLTDLLDKLYSVFLEEQLTLQRKKTIVRIFLELLGLLTFGYVYFMVIQKTVLGEISIGQTTFYVAAINTLQNRIYGLFRIMARSYEDGLFIKDFFDLLDLKNNIVSGNQIIDTQLPLKIEFRNVWFKYPNSKKYVFKDFNFVLNSKDRLAIVGENGAGKTTLIKLLLRFYDVNKGEILINDKNIKDYNLENLYEQFAALSQEFVRYHFDAKTNIAFGNIKNSENSDLVLKSAKLSGADEFIQKLDNKYNQVLSKQFEGGTDLSTGQWQKIALARAFFKNSPILILDEPTSAIDPKAEYKIFEKIFDFAKEKTVLIISHRFSTVRNANRILVLDGGKIVEEGTHKELLEKNGMYKEAYDLQKKGYEDV